MQPYPEAYVEYLVHFHGTRDFFECHELLEEHWKQERDPALRDVWHMLIQVAVSAYHERRGNLKGALKMLEAAGAKLATADPALAGLDAVRFRDFLSMRIHTMQSAIAGSAHTYLDPELPIRDRELLRLCIRECELRGIGWNRISPAEDAALIHRHTLRDRTPVIRERQSRLEAKYNTDPEGSGGTGQ